MQSAKAIVEKDCGCDCTCGITEDIIEAEEKAGYPPNCNEGFKVSEDGSKCVKKKGKSSYSSEEVCECPVGEELIDGECQIVAVTLELDIGESKAIVNAETGNTIIEISGVAFHEGMNKNKWSLTPEGALSVAQQMGGADLTLFHPQADDSGSGFTRNIDGDIEEAVVGHIIGASFFTTQNGYEVRYVAHVTREELFDTFDDGLWMQDGYGVSIGGSGVPIEASEDGLIFSEDFTFDHLALVAKPAYERASVEKAIYKYEELPAVSTEGMFIGHSTTDDNQPMVITMTEDTVTDEIDYEAEIEALKADLVLSNSKNAEYEAVAAQRVEDERTELVEKATEMGMSGHEDLKTETLETLIASWEEAHPEPTPVEMTPVESVEKPVAEVVEASSDRPVVENYLNGRIVKNDEEIYAKAYNAWASAWNQTLATDEKQRMRAVGYDELKEMI